MNRATKTQKQKSTKVTKVATKKQPVKKVTKRTFRSTKAQRSHLYAHQTVFSAPEAPQGDDYVVQSHLAMNPVAANIMEESAPIWTHTLQKTGHGLGSLPVDRKSPVTIYHPCKNAMQNQKNDTFRWALREHRSRSDMTNQLAGDDYATLNNQFFPKFATKDQAIEYCELEGLEYVIEPEPFVRRDTRSYSDNFKWKGPPKNNDDL